MLASAQATRVIAPLVARYIARNRSQYIDIAQPLSSAKHASLAPFFPPEVLAMARFAPALPRLFNPDFYGKVRALGIRRLPDFANVAAITFIDVIVHQAPLADDLIFHELVHVVQYQQLGLRAFARLYVKGFLEGGSYTAIPLERQAYELEARFKAAPHSGFSVADEVRQAIAAGYL